MYNDCWTYPKEKIDELIEEAKSKGESGKVKFPDGTMILWGVKTQTGTYTESGSLYSKSFSTINFPESFKAAPTAFIRMRVSGSNVPIWGDCSASASSISSIVGYAPKELTNVSTAISWMAIGRYK